MLRLSVILVDNLKVRLVKILYISLFTDDISYTMCSYTHNIFKEKLHIAR
jgi:hypothetical protein